MTARLLPATMANGTLCENRAANRGARGVPGWRVPATFSHKVGWLIVGPNDFPGWRDGCPGGFSRQRDRPRNRFGRCQAAGVTACSVRGCEPHGRFGGGGWRGRSMMAGGVDGARGREALTSARLVRMRGRPRTGRGAVRPRHRNQSGRGQTDFGGGMRAVGLLGGPDAQGRAS